MNFGEDRDVSHIQEVRKSGRATRTSLDSYATETQKFVTLVSGSNPLFSELFGDWTVEQKGDAVIGQIARYWACPSLTTMALHRNDSFVRWTFMFSFPVDFTFNNVTNIFLCCLHRNRVCGPFKRPTLG